MNRGLVSGLTDVSREHAYRGSRKDSLSTLLLGPRTRAGGSDPFVLLLLAIVLGKAKANTTAVVCDCMKL
jgi:hypothetical protein